MSLNPLKKIMSIFASFLLQFCFTRFYEAQVTNCLTSNYKKTLNFALQWEQIQQFGEFTFVCYHLLLYLCCKVNENIRYLQESEKTLRRFHPTTEVVGFPAYIL